MGHYLWIGICSLVGGTAILYAVKRIVENFVFINNAKKTLATVISFATARNSDGGATYLPVLEFKTAEGKTVHFTSTVASNPPAYKIGDKVRIYFPVKNPQAAKIDSISEIWFVPAFCVVLGTTFLGGAALAFWLR